MPLTSENPRSAQALYRSSITPVLEPEKRNSVRRLGQSGQIIVEYVLLLAVAVIVAAIITRMMISPDT